MRYQFNFQGPMMTGSTGLLHAVEGGLNRLTTFAQTSADPEPTTVQPPPKDPCVLTKTCSSTTHIGHDPGVVVAPGLDAHGPDIVACIVIAVISVGIGCLIGYLVGKRSAPATNLANR